MSASATPGPEDAGDASPRAGTGTRIASAAGIMVAAILLSRVLGLVRDIVVAYYFGASDVTDAYIAAFRLPDLLYFLIAGGALSSAFIPVFTEYLTKGDEESAWHVFSVFGTALTFLLTFIIVAGWIFTPWLLVPLAPGYLDDPSKFQLTVHLTRIVLPAQLCFFIGGLMMSTLYARQHFLFPALGPVVYNIAIIIGGAIGGQFWGPVRGIDGLAWGVVVGAFLGNVVMQLWMLRRLGVRYHFSLNVRHEGVVRVAKLMLPVLLGLSLPYLCVILSTPFASDLGDRPVTWLDRANKLMQMPLGIFAQALSVAIFPTLSALAAQQDWDGFRKQFSLGIRSVLFLTIPSAVLIIILAVPLSAILFQHGKGTWEDTVATASAAGVYALAIFAVSAQQVVNRGFYSRQNTVTPMLVGSGATFVFLALNVLLLGIPGQKSVVSFAQQVHGSKLLALAYVLAMAIYLTVLLVLFQRAMGGIRGREIAASVVRVIVASVLMGAAAWGAQGLFHQWLVPYGPGGVRTLGTLAEILLCSGVGGVVYLAAVKLMRVPEAEFVFDAVSRRFARFGRRGQTPAAK
ncbi:MAG: murein biosynthesis integral membrane protein MurJ [Armatimonadota bacterium]